MFSALLSRSGIGKARGPTNLGDLPAKSRTRPRAIVLVDFGGTASHFYSVTKAAVSYQALLNEARKNFDVVSAFMVFPQSVILAKTDIVAQFEEMGYFVHVVSQLDHNAQAGQDRVDDTILSLARLMLSAQAVNDVVIVSEHNSVLIGGKSRIEKSCGGHVHPIRPSHHPELYTAKDGEPKLLMPFLVKLKDVHTIIDLAQSGGDIPEDLRRVAEAIAFAFRVCEERFQHDTVRVECIDVLDKALNIHDEHIHPKSAGNILDVFVKRGVLLARQRGRRLLIRYNPEHKIVTKKAVK